MFLFMTNPNDVKKNMPKKLVKSCLNIFLKSCPELSEAGVVTFEAPGAS